ncbi:MAG TPA: hypothetical protein VMX56_05140 [Anaerolineales bacterium]|nr:hypothetical protein [Anaerolineales bacterium]
MNGRARQIGFSQRIRLEWLEKTTNLVLAGSDRESIQVALQELLRDKVSIGGSAQRGNREKIITILMKIWVNVPKELEPFRDLGLELLKRKKKNIHLAVHWGMTVAVYPFWGTVAACVGRLLRLQGTVAPAQVQRRIREQYGERETVSRAARRTLRSFIDWGVLAESKEKGFYQPTHPRPISDDQMVKWLFESILMTRENRSSALSSLREDPSLFPFAINHVSSNAIERSGGLEVVKHGLDDELVLLRRENQTGGKGNGG